MKNSNYYFTLLLVLYTTIYSFFHMLTIVNISKEVIMIVLNNLLPSLLPFMIIISLCLSLGINHLFSYFIQFIFTPLFHLSPHASTIYFLSFFCGYPTNAKMMKESYELGYITIDELNHLLSIASFASPSFIFVSLKLKSSVAFMIYLSHVLPSLIIALCYRRQNQIISFNETIKAIKPIPFIQAIKRSITSSLYAFIFILGYMLVFQIVGNSLSIFIKNEYILAIIQGVLEFSSGSIKILEYHNLYVYPFISFFLSFSGCSVLMQIDNLLENIPYSFRRYFKDRLIHGICSFLIYFFIEVLTNSNFLI